MTIATFYLASPFFSSNQLELVQKIEELVESFDFHLFSPRRSGVLLEMTPEERKKNSRLLFEQNVHEIDHSDAILAVIDEATYPDGRRKGPDGGTYFEVGYGYGRGKKIFTFSNFDHDINIMLKGCVTGHARRLDQLEKMLLRIIEGHDLKEFEPDMGKVF